MPTLGSKPDPTPSHYLRAEPPSTRIHTHKYLFIDLALILKYKRENKIKIIQQILVSLLPINSRTCVQKIHHPPITPKCFRQILVRLPESPKAVGWEPHTLQAWRKSPNTANCDLSEEQNKLRWNESKALVGRPSIYLYFDITPSWLVPTYSLSIFKYYLGTPVPLSTKIIFIVLLRHSNEK